MIQQLQKLRKRPVAVGTRPHQQQEAAPGMNLSEAMGYLRESTARDTAADEVRALNSKVGVLAHSHSRRPRGPCEPWTRP